MPERVEGLPVVSVVTAVHNGRAELRESLESVLGQEGPCLELIVVDDGSTDGSSEVLASLAAYDSRVRVFTQENRGLTEALIRGCAEARGEFIARHDADDLSLPGRLAQQIEYLRRESALAFVSCWTRAQGPSGETLWETRPATNAREAADELAAGGLGPPHHGSVVFRRDAYRRAGGYRAAFYFGQDNDLWLRLLEQGGYAVAPEILYSFRIRVTSISATRSRTQRRYGHLAHACRRARLAGESEEPFLAEAASLRPSGHDDQRAENPLAGSYFIARCLVARRNPRAILYLGRAVRQYPTNTRVWLGVLGSLLELPMRLLIGR